MTRAEKRAANKAAHVNAGARNKGSGAGWGGGANGEGNTSSGPGRPVGVKNGEGKQALNSARAEELREFYYEVAKNAAEPTLVRLAAADKFLDRVEGKAIARSVSTAVDDVSQLSDLELAAEIARLERELAQGEAGAGEAAAGE